MEIEEVLRVLAALDRQGVRAWIEGGWGVDALLGRQTRPHRDLDVDVDARLEARTLAVLGRLGYAIETDQRPTRVELVASRGGRVDVHPLRFDAAGDARQAMPDGSWWRIPRRFFGTGRLGGTTVECYTLEAQRDFHTGYPLREIDRTDLAVLQQIEQEAAADPASAGRSPGWTQRPEATDSAMRARPTTVTAASTDADASR